tara:strand:+ start:165 stop:362 length:198 start_codon:yes stop_codon:yes gene_type:complete
VKAHEWNIGDLVNFSWDLKHQPIGVVIDIPQGSITIKWFVGNQKGQVKCYHPNTHEGFIKLKDKK